MVSLNNPSLLRSINILMLSYKQNKHIIKNKKLKSANCFFNILIKKNNPVFPFLCPFSLKESNLIMQYFVVRKKLDTQHYFHI